MSTSKLAGAALVWAACCGATPAALAAGLPLPEAPLRLHVPDAVAFDQALSGAFRAALNGRLDEGDPLAAAWRRTQVGSKLEDQWRAFAHDLGWTWDDLRRLQPRELGLALLDVGQLEAVLALSTPLAALPVALPAGQARTHRGVRYQVVTGGAADGLSDDRRMGLAYAFGSGRLLLATSERGLRLALDAEQDGRLWSAALPGLVGLELDLDRLRRDLYFKREFLFDLGDQQGRVQAALRLEQDRLVEVREGSGAAAGGAAVFDWQGAAALGWEEDGAGLLVALRAGLLEPRPGLEARPWRARGPLPPVRAGAAEDPLLVDLERPLAGAGGPSFEAGELDDWRALLASQTPAGWGYALDADGTRRLVFAWPAARQAELEALCLRTLERRSGRARSVGAPGGSEWQVGPGLPALALKRSGEFVWLGPSAHALANAPQPRREPDLVRWARLDLDAVRREGERWQRVEGEASPERVRPLSDRVLGLLGWMPRTQLLGLERRRRGDGWSERVVFGPR